MDPDPIEPVYKEPRPCKVTSHHFDMKGWFHFFGRREDVVSAYVEDDQSGVLGQYNMAYHTIQFLDTKPIPRKE
jgi:hypothetical protein